ncbi:MMPL family transporter [Actinoplanes sp. NBRC 103695]|uniref:MMPL family transporter n=1 Tax=Actinoplanes sp. NBRC 103695 TaxID=3032202 RepID=UPI0025578156|nr:MMPL family transporter [Actinoplanes sp. NBRC 103695]GLY99256.1 membrane protein [Actinoplanes sp. NBRC 103695]
MWFLSRIGAGLILLATILITGLAFAFSPSQPDASPTDGLPAGAQATEVTALADRFPSGRVLTAIVVLERSSGPLTSADNAVVTSLSASLKSRAVPSADGKAVLLPVTLPSRESVDEIRASVRAANLPAGLTGQVTGGAAFGRDIAAAFEGADVTLLIATAAVVAVLLLITYRSPILWVVPLIVIGLGDQVVAKLLPWVARLVGERTDASVAGIVSVLVFGAGTDYALLLVSRYREELRRTPSRREALTAAWRAAAPAIVASAGTVVLALATLLAAVLTSNRTLGVAAATGVLVALAFGLFVLPAALVLLPRGVFWPLVPRVGSADPTETGVWSRVARFVGNRPGAVLLAAIAVLGVCSLGLTKIDIGLAQTEQFRTKVEAVTGQETLSRHYPAGAAQPVVMVVDSPDLDAALGTARTVPGVAAVLQPEKSDDGTLTKVTVQLTDDAGTPAADTAVKRLRSALPDALVGSQPAADLDERTANLRDDRVVVPLILGVVLLVLILLLRSLVAPVLLLVTVVASYAASLGAAVVVLRTFFDQPGLDSSVPLLSFLFLVALGVDYNIFLVTRARDETSARRDTRAGTLRALAATGGVITSAGILLAAVFAVLGVLPVIVLTQIGVIVGLGVLLDTLLVRTIVVPALALLLGDRFWWPARPAVPSPTTASPAAPDLADAESR